jgi:hypothetical protein
MPSQAPAEPIEASEQHAPFIVTIRTLAGHHRKEEVHPKELVSKVADKAVRHFVKKGELTDGPYALTLPRLGGDAELDPTASAHEVGIVAGDVLVLVCREPHVDG